MDSITQALLGANVGVACTGRKLGRKAAWWGALGGLIPDFDALVVAPFGEFATLVAHRGSSHSLWFGPVVGSALGFLLWKYWYQPRDPNGVGHPSRARDWILLFSLSILTHPLLDVFTSYGTQLLAPFSRRRFVLDGVGIIDPFYTLPLIIALLIARRARQRPNVGKWVTWGALGLTTSYLFYGVVLTRRAERFAVEQLHQQGINASVTGYTTVLQPWLRRLIGRSVNRTGKPEVHIGYVSMLRPSPISWHRFQTEQHPAIDALRNSERGQLFEWFASGQTVGHLKPPDVVELDDIRYGLPNAPEFGLWGVRAHFSQNSPSKLSKVERFNRPRGEFWSTIPRMYQAAWGYEPELFRVGVISNEAK